MKTHINNKKGTHSLSKSYNSPFLTMCMYVVSICKKVRNPSLAIAKQQPQSKIQLFTK